MENNNSEIILSFHKKYSFCIKNIIGEFDNETDETNGIVTIRTNKKEIFVKWDSFESLYKNLNEYTNTTIKYDEIECFSSSDQKKIFIALNKAHKNWIKSSQSKIIDKNLEGGNKKRIVTQTRLFWSPFILSVIALGFSCFTLATNKEEINGNTDYSIPFISLIAISATFIVGFQIFNAIDYRNTIAKYEKTHNEAIKELEILKVQTKNLLKGIDDANGNLRKSDADHSRMMGHLLRDINPIWSVGWGCRAMSRYIKFNRDYGKSFNINIYENILKECIPSVLSSIIIFYKKLKDSKSITKTAEVTRDKIIEHLTITYDFAKNEEIHNRAFTDIIDYRIHRSESGLFGKLYLKETKEQEEIINLFLELLHTVINYDRCSQISKFGKNASSEKFEKESSTFISGRECIVIYKEFEIKCEEFINSLDLNQRPMQIRYSYPTGV